MHVEELDELLDEEVQVDVEEDGWQHLVSSEEDDEVQVEEDGAQVESEESSHCTFLLQAR